MNRPPLGTRAETALVVQAREIIFVHVSRPFQSTIAIRVVLHEARIVIRNDATLLLQRRIREIIRRDRLARCPLIRPPSRSRADDLVRGTGESSRRGPGGVRRRWRVREVRRGVARAVRNGRT